MLAMDHGWMAAVAVDGKRHGQLRERSGRGDTRPISEGTSQKK
jgi:hypothetical protein